MKLFGKGGIELGPLFTDGPGAMKAMREEAEKLGMVVSEEGVKAVAAMNDSVDKLFQTFTAIVAQVVSKLAPVVSDMAKELLGVVQSMGGENIANIVVKVLLDAIDFVAEALLRFAQFLDQLIKTIGPLIGIDFRTALEKQIAQLSALEGYVTMSESEMKKLAELRLQAEKEAAEKAAQGSYESIIDTIKKATEEARKRLGPDGKPTGDTTNKLGSFSDQGIIRELKELNRNSRYSTVEIVG